jgi:hypothetical protein
MFAFFFLMILVCTAYISHITTKKYYNGKELLLNVEIEKANQKTVKAEVDKLYWKDKCEALMKDLTSSFEDVNYQEPPKKDKDIPQVYDYLDFVPDYLPDIEEELSEDNRIAEVKYPYRDEVNNYNVDFDIKYSYGKQVFKITPSNLSNKRKMNYKFCFGVYYHMDTAGLRLEYDLWRFRIGSDVGFTKDLKPDVGVSLGWKF